MAAKKAQSRVKAGTSKDAAQARKRLFVEAYIQNGGNATEAAVKAGYSPGPSARVQGCRLLADPNITSEIEKRSEAVAKKYELTTEMVMRSIVQELSFDPAKLYDAEGRLRPITDLDEDTRMVLAGIEFEQHGSQDAPVFVRKVKWSQRQGAREHAMKHLGMFSEDNKQRNPLDGIPRDTLKALVERLGG